MSRRDERAQLAQEAAVKDRRRLILFGGGLLLCAGILVTLNRGDSEEDPATPVEPEIRNVMAMPPIDQEQLGTVKDTTTGDRVIIEPEPFKNLASAATALWGSTVVRLGEPAFPFADGEARSAELRGLPFRARGKLIEAEIRERVPGRPPEFWTLIETDAGDQFFFASLVVPETLFGNENYVLADGFFFKYYTQTIGGQRLTAPLLVGRELTASFPAIGPASSPDLTLLSAVHDPEIDRPMPLDERGLWHLLNVARTVQGEDGGMERAFADAAVLDDAVLEDVVHAPEAYRGAPFLLGGMVRGISDFEVLGETPLRMERMSSAWLRNNSSTIDTLIRVCAPNDFDFLNPPGAVQMHGWFLQLYAYEDKDGNLRRAPVFVVTDIEGVRGTPPPWAGGVLWGFIGLSVLLAGIMTVMVRRDKVRTAEWEESRREKRRQARQG